MFSLWDTHSKHLENLTSKLENPFFYYDLDAFEKHLETMRMSSTKLWYAVKANPLSSVIQTLHSQKYRFDVASLGELRQVLRQDVSPDDILYTGPAKSKAQLNTFLNASVKTYVLESIQQVHDLNKLATSYDFTPNVLLRVQLTWDNVEHKNVLGGATLTPFGLSPNEWTQLKLLHFPNVNFKGLHIFQWGNILDPLQLSQIWHEIIPQLQRLAKALDLTLEVIDLGGGLGIPYAQNDQELQWDQVQTVLQTLQTACPETKIWMELGRYAIGSFGCYLTQVVDRKSINGHEMLVLSGGVNHLLRPGIISQPFPAKRLRKTSAPLTTMEVHGPLCTSLDKLGSFELPNDTQIGDWLCFSQCGAYGFTESMPWFLCHTLPAEVIFKHNEVKIIRYPEQPESWMK